MKKVQCILTKIKQSDTLEETCKKVLKHNNIKLDLDFYDSFENQLFFEVDNFVVYEKEVYSVSKVEYFVLISEFKKQSISEKQIKINFVYDEEHVNFKNVLEEKK